ncbi:hypothetical protein JR316_0010306 [Psilocybe cubensis]|uniref:Uncharacterized protein n=2 Tax=Psilocybe cubensis TaxID=181762 RepID=A0ACB8GSR5_PSICU|nr:hypothetical protein JR316_0010306 [Psilocybe cubensis]KAH9478069.1 hypothetical protein JR316_0010306 [Psilocybe cubensis]
MAPKYELLPTEPSYSPSSSRPESPSYPPPYEAEQEYHPFENDIEEEAPRRPRIRRDPIPPFDSDPRFRIRTPSPFARAALIIFVVFLFWLAFALRKAMWVAGGMGMNKVVPDVDPSY